MITTFTSKLRSTLSSLVFVAVALSGSAHAQGSRGQVKVAIPFAFQDGATHMNAGVYIVGLHNQNTMLVRGPRGSASTFSIVNIGETLQPATAGKVVFHKYGDRYFLREVWMKGSSTYLECPTSKAERNLQKELQLASSRQDATGTEVALLELPQ